MTPQERELVEGLFDRVAQLENAPRDPEAQRVIEDGAKRAPHALYALVQTALVQDEALKRANARIEELQAQLGEGGTAPAQGGFLDNMRDALFGKREAPPTRGGSVPSVRPQGSSSPFANAPGYQSQAGGPPPGYPPQGGYPPQAGYAQGGYPPGGYPGGSMFGGGSSFLGTAASTAAGVIGGALLLDGIRSMFGHRSGFGGGYGQSAFGDYGGSPWAGGSAGSAADSDLARQAGLNDIGQSGGGSGDYGDNRAGLLDASDDRGGDTAGSDFADDDGGGDFGGDSGGGDSDYA